jgi:hypothetical protein
MPTARTHPTERRTAELPERLHAMTTERSILAMVAMRRISL